MLSCGDPAEELKSPSCEICLKKNCPHPSGCMHNVLSLCLSFIHELAEAVTEHQQMTVNPSFNAISMSALSNGHAVRQPQLLTLSIMAVANTIEIGRQVLVAYKICLWDLHWICPRQNATISSIKWLQFKSEFAVSSSAPHWTHFAFKLSSEGLKLA